MGAGGWRAAWVLNSAEATHVLPDQDDLQSTAQCQVAVTSGPFTPHVVRLRQTAAAFSLGGRAVLKEAESSEERRNCISRFWVKRASQFATLQTFSERFSPRYF